MNTVRRSGKCERCRASKTKCNEARPACARCAKGGRPCVYKPLDDSFRSMNRWSETSVQHRVAKTQAQREHWYMRTPARLVPLQWVSEAIGPFFDQHVQQPDAYASTWGFLSHLPCLYVKLGPSHYLAHAINANAVANLANVSKVADLEKVANQFYCNALLGLRDAIYENDIAASPEILTTMMLLTLYEVITGSTPSSYMFHSHHQGMAAILRLQEFNYTSDDSNKRAWAQVNRMLLWRDMAEYQRPSLCVTEWPPSTYRSWLDETCMRVCIQVADLCGRTRELRETPLHMDERGLKIAIASCIRDALELDCYIESCFDHAAPDWKARTLSPGWVPTSIVNPASSPRAEGDVIQNGFVKPNDSSTFVLEKLPAPVQPASYTPRIDIYPTRVVSLLWNYIRCARLQLLQSMGSLLPMFEKQIHDGSAFVPLPSTLHQKLSDTVHDICAAIPYQLQWLGQEQTAAPKPEGKPNGNRKVHSGDAVSLLWVLAKVCAVPGLSAPVKAWAMDVLDYIGNACHLRQALELRRVLVQT